jgi:ribose 5-phosphate isomerase B
MSKIYICAEHCGVVLKEFLLAQATSDALEIVDIYPVNDPDDDYPDVAKILAKRLLDNPTDFGVVICGSGQGIAMSANRFSHIRCAIPTTVESVVKTREHNDTNVLSFSASIDQNLAMDMLKALVNSPASTVERHARRVAKMTDPKFSTLD